MPRKKTTKKTVARKRAKTKKKAATPAASTVYETGKTHYYKGILLGKVPRQHNFVLANGDQVRSLIELTYRLEFLDSSVYDHHTTQGRHDFANWVRDVYNDDKLARRMEKSVTKKDLQTTLLKQLLNNLR